jgi:NitT/TauT family transport system substrate-binding protein
VNNSDQTTFDRRRFLSGTTALGATSLLVWPEISRAEPPPEIKKIRLVHTPAICISPQYLAEEFLRLEGFTEIEYVVSGDVLAANIVADGRADFTQDGVSSLLPLLDAGRPVVTLAGVHAGCYELFAHKDVRAITDLRGKRIAIPGIGSNAHMLMASMLAYVGIDPQKQVSWVIGEKYDDSAPFVDGRADAIIAFAPQPQELRAKKMGHVILNTTFDRPWSQYFCCVVLGQKEFVSKYPIATKRALRAFLKATDVCADQPERAAKMLVDKGYEPRYDLALEILRELPYKRWREASAEDTLRFHALRLHEVGMIKTSPNKLVAQGSDWRFLNELKRELKA